jgi:hypothetical protein
MRRLAWWASRLYPAAWRERYGTEFEALLEDAPLQSGDVWDVLWGALTMRMTRSNLVGMTAGLAVLGGLIAGVATLGSFAGYTSTGTLRAQLADKDPATAAVAVQRAIQATVSRGSLAELIQQPELDLYREERAKEPLEDIIMRMRRDIAIQDRAAGAGRAEMKVSFRYADAALAQRTNAALMDRLRSEMVAQVPVEVIEAAGPAQSILTGKRWQIVAIGMLAGLGLGIAFSAAWSLVRNRQRWNLWRIGGFAAAGAVVGIGVAVIIPDVFISTAVIRTSAPLNPEVARTVLSDQALGEIIRSLGLYPNEIASRPLAHLAERMRKEDIRVQVVDAPGVSTGTVYTIAYRDHDRVKAQSVTRALVSSWLKTGVVTKAITTEVLDPPSNPVAPISPNRLTIALIGTAAGLLLGLAAARVGRSPSAGAVPDAPTAS